MLCKGVATSVDIVNTCFSSAFKVFYNKSIVSMKNGNGCEPASIWGCILYTLFTLMLFKNLQGFYPSFEYGLL